MDLEDVMLIMISAKVATTLSIAMASFPTSDTKKGINIMKENAGPDPDEKVQAFFEVMDALFESVDSFKAKTEDLMARKPHLFDDKASDFLKNFKSDIIH